MGSSEIYVLLKGRIGNQLFIYAFARYLQLNAGADTKIIINDYEVTQQKWLNSLEQYDLPNVVFEHGRPFFNNARFRGKIFKRNLIVFAMPRRNYNKRFSIEARKQEALLKDGIFICHNGFREFSSIDLSKDILIDGYFQSSKFFPGIKKELVNLFVASDKEIREYYNEFDKYTDRNTVCISIKVEHNVGSNIYAVCGKDYWKKAIDHIIQNVDQPVFMICSDDIDYVKENLIDTNHYDCFYQNRQAPLSVTISAMSKCRNYIIGNTTFAWWAQYLCQNKEKIVVAPSKWMLVDMPIDIYEDGWYLI